MIAEYNKTTKELKEHVYAPSGRLATLVKRQIYWHHNDHLGTPQAMTDINGTVVWTMRQTPFGIATVNEDPSSGDTVMTNIINVESEHPQLDNAIHNSTNSYLLEW